MIPIFLHDGVSLKQPSLALSKRGTNFTKPTKPGERGLWQRRFWEHQIRDEADFHRHIDYIHWNPVKHGWVQQVADWPHSSFHAYLERGIYQKHWCGNIDLSNVLVGE